MKKKLSNLADKIEIVIMTILSIGAIYMVTKFIINLYIGG